MVTFKNSFIVSPPLNGWRTAYSPYYKPTLEIAISARGGCEFSPILT